MGYLYQLHCDTCEYARDVSLGAGMGGCDTTWFCTKCGCLKSQWRSMEDMERRVPEPPPPTCGVHPGMPMVELWIDDERSDRSDVLTGVPCRRKCPGHMIAQWRGLWD